MSSNYYYLSFNNINSFTGDLNNYIKTINGHVDEHMNAIKSELLSTTARKTRNMSLKSSLYLSMLSEKYELEFNLMLLNLNPEDNKSLAIGIRNKLLSKLSRKESDLIIKTANKIDSLADPIMREARIAHTTRDLALRKRIEIKKYTPSNLIKTVAKEVNF